MTSQNQPNIYLPFSRDRKCSRPKCNEPAWEGSDRCLFHPHHPRNKPAGMSR